MSFSQGDKVEVLIKISGGIFGQDIPPGTRGVVLSENWSGTSCRVHFEAPRGSEWVGSRETDIDVPTQYLKKR